MPKEPKTRILLLEGTAHWESIRQTLPLLKSLWMSLPAEHFSVTPTKNINLKHLVPGIIQNDIVAIFFIDYQIATLLKWLKTNLNNIPPLILYTYGHPSRLYSDFHHLGLDKVLSDQDLLLVNCQADLTLTKACFPNAPATIIPLPVPPISTVETSDFYKALKLKKHNFLYTGRISTQKNIHYLLTAFAHLKKTHNDFTFHLIGDFDDLATPVVGREKFNYQKLITELIQHYQLQAYVFIHPHQRRELIQKLFQTNDFYYICASTHSDENFGLASWEFLQNSQKKAILTCWGGLQDQIKSKKNQCETIPVYQTQIGPTILINEIIQRIDSLLLSSCSGGSRTEVDSNSQLTKILSDHIKSVKKKTPSPYQSSPLRDEVIHFKNQNYPQKKQIFSSYKDKNAQYVMQVYGAKKQQKKFPIINNDSTFTVPFWVKKRGNKVTIEDPQKDFFEIDLTPPYNETGGPLYFDFHKKYFYIQKNDIEKLILLGQVYTS